MLSIRLLQKVDLTGYTLIEGFPGAGLVGPMAISYIIEKLSMKYIGYIESSKFPPLIAIHADKPMPPVRIYANDKAKIVTILAEFAIPIDVTYDLAHELYDFVKSSGITEIVSIGGIPSASQNIESGTVFAITSTDDMKGEVKKAGLKQVGEGVATGVSALMMVNAVNDGLSDVNVLVPVDPNVLNPKYAEAAIVAINKLINLKVDVSDLEKEAKEVETKVRELLKRNKEVTDVHKKVAGEEGPSMYA